MTILISAAELSLALGATEGAPLVLDVRWRLTGPPGRGSYDAGHIPGAVFVDLDRELARHGLATDGRHPLPALDDLQAAARGWGLRSGQAVVVYDDDGNRAAARAWWLLRWGGVEDVRLLDGGLQAWTAAGERLAVEQPRVEAGDVTLSGDGLPVLDLDDVLPFAESGLLLDARGAERYRGDAEPIDPRAGHIPGAVSAPTADNLTPDQHFLDPALLRRRFVSLGAGPDRPIAVYCGSGVTAAHQIAALSVAGFQAALYPGSWSQWSNHDELPVATGA